ncbi:MAG TPA: amino acid ABC transporter substrate-binding protein [Myxococcaceae bacterium]|nr:amino acid ABC transporter substrate-binding protein [Myxococcaceae bacterium]
MPTKCHIQRSRGATASLTALLLTAACKPDQIFIGATLPLSGAEARIGGLYKEGYELAFEEATHRGGLLIDGKRVPVTLRLLDDESSPAKAISLAERLIKQDKVSLLLGTYSTLLVQPQSAVAEKYRVPYVNGGGAATEIYRQGYRYVFGVLAPVELMADAIMRWVHTEQKAGKLPQPSTIAVLWQNTFHGKDFRQGVSQFVATHGSDYKIVLDRSFERNTRDFSEPIKELQAARADVVLADTYLPDYISMHRQYVDAGICSKVLSYGARGPEKQASEVLGQKSVNYIISAVWWNHQLGSKGLTKQFVDLFRAKFNRQPEFYQALGYETARVLFTAIEQANSLDREAIRTKLASLDVESILPGGRLTLYEEQGHQAHYPFVVQQDMPDGSSPIVYPLDVANAPAVVPNPECK